VSASVRARPDAKAWDAIQVIGGLGVQRSFQSTGYHSDRRWETGTFPPSRFEVFGFLEPALRSRGVLHDAPLMIEGQDARDIVAVLFDGSLRAKRRYFQANAQVRDDGFRRVISRGS